MALVFTQCVRRLRTAPCQAVTFHSRDCCCRHVFSYLRSPLQLDLRETTVHRRFRDFFAVNEALRSAYKGSHLLSSFPPLPPRSLKLFEDHMSMAFIEKRRWQLQDWMFKVSQVRACVRELVWCVGVARASANVCSGCSLRRVLARYEPIQCSVAPFVA